MAKPRILIADDDPHVLKMTKLRLEHEGYEVISAEDGERLLQQVHTASPATPIHLILMDVKMPKLDGYEVCQRLKRHPATAHIPVVIFSASEGQLQRLANRCIELGAAGWLKKPFRTNDLMTTIHRALREGEERHG